jgi:cellulose synthase/poly-beta-1,6-N-acetylglucosamine synthase-like glycosyltransferase
MADENPYLDVVRVEGSTSKAQNVNAVLHLARGKITGMFDADHEPRPGSFERAWRWLTDGYDVVHGYCLTRNGDASWLAKMIAVEFESIYVVAHPGRAKLHRFGVFGGSNGYWQTELLHETRMRGSMLTADIDSSMRALERGFHIRSDRNIVSRELGTTTFPQVWNQRMRWAQGWFQVTLVHVNAGWIARCARGNRRFRMVGCSRLGLSGRVVGSERGRRVVRGTSRRRWPVCGGNHC